MIKIRLLLIIAFTFLYVNSFSQNSADSLYKLAWKKHNNQEYVKAAQLFEKCITEGNNWSGTYLNAASSWAYADNKEKTFENLFKMIDAGYLDKNFILFSFTDFYKYHKSNEWIELISLFDKKRSEFYKYAETVEFQNLTKEQMYQDYDTLIHKLIQISPHLKIREQVCNLNFDTKFTNLRAEIENCNSAEDFSLILYKALISCQDGHTSFSSLNPFEYLGNGKNLDFCASIAKYETHFHSVRVTETNLPKLVYHKGKYYTSSDFSYKGNIIVQGTELLKVNNIKPSEYILQNIDKKRFLSWDFENNCFFSETFLQLNIATDSLINLTFLRNKKETSLPIKLEIGYIPKKIKTVKNGYVWYWQNEQILYIRMPRMANGVFYANEIQKYSDKKLKKVIIDIRNNRGGSDYDWEDVLNAIYPVNINIKLDIAKNKTVFDKDTTLISFETIQGLNLVYKTVPKRIGGFETKNIDYSGKIYIFYNKETFSAAGSLVSSCYYSDRLVAVGQETGRVLGFGTKPREYQLSNTKIKYRIAPVVDITNVSNLKDVFHDEPEINIDLDLNERIILKNNPFTIDFLNTEKN